MGDTCYDMPADAPHSAEDFAKYFLQKIDSIRRETASAVQAGDTIYGRRTSQQFCSCDSWISKKADFWSSE